MATNQNLAILPQTWIGKVSVTTLEAFSLTRGILAGGVIELFGNTRIGAGVLPLPPGGGGIYYEKLFRGRHGQFRPCRSIKVKTWKNHA